MKKAKLDDGQVILAPQYTEAQRGKLYCADQFCMAAMTHRKQCLTHGSQFVREAAFVSLDVKQHRHACSAHEEIKILARHKKSIDEALRKQKPVIINLNLQMADEFNTLASRNAVGAASTHMFRDYASVPAKSIEDVLYYMQVVEAKAGGAGLALTYINHDGSVTPLDKFVVKDRDAYRDLLRKGYAMLTATPADEVAGAARLMIFEKNATQRGDEDLTLRGSEFVYQKNNGGQMVVRSKLEAKPEFASALDSGQKIYLIARPVMNYAEAKAAHEGLQMAQTVCFDLHWNVVNAAQFTAVDEQPAKSKSKAKTPKAV